MTLSKEKQDKIIEKINEAIKKKSKKTDFECPICTNTQFLLVESFTNDPLADHIGGNLTLGGQVLPSAPIVCTNCGNTFFLNTKILGLNEEDFKEQAKESDIDKNS